MKSKCHKCGVEMSVPEEVLRKYSKEEITYKPKEGEMKGIKKIHGDRVCQHCKGICHEETFREKYGQRKKYFCCSHCLRTHIENEIKKHIKSPRAKHNFVLSLDEFTKHWAYDYELVDVISRG